MVEPIVTGGVVLLIIAEIFKFVNRIRTSSCWGGSVTFNDNQPNASPHITITHHDENTEKKTEYSFSG